MTRAASSASGRRKKPTAGKARKAAAPKRPRRRRVAPADPRRLTPAEVREHPVWGPLLCEQIPGAKPGTWWDPTEQAEGCVFDALEAQEALDIYPRIIRHVEPPFEGQPFSLEPWQASITANLFGWKRPHQEKGGAVRWVRRFREVFAYLPKKNGKSTFVAALGLNLMRRAPRGSSFFSAASSEQQAALIHNVARGMVLAETELARRIRPYGSAAGAQRLTLVWIDQRISWRVLAADADTIDGVNPYFVSLDELHRHPNGHLANVLEKGMAAQREPVLITTTTADFNRPSPCNDKLAYARSVRDNHGDRARPGYDPTFLPAIWETPPTVVKDGSWRDPETWRRANPNLNVSVTEEFLQRQCQQAIEQPSKLNDFLRFHLNVVTEQAEAWLNMMRWDECTGLHVMKPGALHQWVEAMGLHRRPCYPALDLAKTADLNAFTLLFPPLSPREPMVVLPYFWLPQKSRQMAEERDRAPYAQWVREGFLEETPGDVTDYGYIEDRILQEASRFQFQPLAYDPWNATQFAQRLTDKGLKCVEYRQGFKSFNEPAKELERLVMTHGIAHGGHPVLRWCAQNAMVERDAPGNIKPSKVESTGRIDGVVALCMSLGLHILTGQTTETLDDIYSEDPLEA